LPETTIEILAIKRHLKPLLSLEVFIGRAAVSSLKIACKSDEIVLDRLKVFG